MKKSSAPNVTYPDSGGIAVKNWFWASAAKMRRKPKESTSPDQTGTQETPAPGADAEAELQDILLQNPNISAATFVNMMKAKGLKVAKVTEAFRSRVHNLCIILESRKGGALLAAAPKDQRSERRVHMKLFGHGIRFLEASPMSSACSKIRGKRLNLKTREADSGSAHAAVTREAADIKLHGIHMMEAGTDDGIGPTKFKVILIQEGLGNFGDAYYYHRDALESAIPVFTGAKIYADHPSAVEEETRPERSVRDVLGHFENIQVETDKEDRAMLTGEVHVLPDKPYEWARALMRHTISYAKKFPDKDFVGLSINAAGDAERAPIESVLEMAPKSAKAKISEAMKKGIESVRVVRSIKKAISCDLVTEAGAGGKIINLIEGDKAHGQKRN